MSIRAGAFMGGLIGVVMISAVTFSSVGYGEDSVREYDANGNLKSEKSFKDGKLEGIFKVYYDSGQLRRDGSYKNGKRNGPFKTYHGNGQLVLDEFYKDGKQDGAFKTYYGNGKLRSYSLYKDGIPVEGTVKGYDESGNSKS